MMYFNENIYLGKYLETGMGSWVVRTLFYSARFVPPWLFLSTNINKNQNPKCRFATQKWIFTSFRLEMC